MHMKDLFCDFIFACYTIFGDIQNKYDVIYDLSHNAPYTTKFTNINYEIITCNIWDEILWMCKVPIFILKTYLTINAIYIFMFNKVLSSCAHYAQMLSL